MTKMVIKRSNSVNVRVKLSRWASAPTARFVFNKDLFGLVILEWLVIGTEFHGVLIWTNCLC